MKRPGRKTRTTRPNRVAIPGAPQGITARRDRMARALARRGPAARQLLALFLVERMTPHEIACALGLTPEAVVQHVRALLADLHGDGGTPAGAPRRRRATDAPPAPLRREAA